jgi:uncharacterized protein (DUF1684 family)
MMKTERIFVWIVLITLIILCLLLLIPGCQHAEKIDPVYLQEVEEWHSKRIASLTKPNSWLSLAGLFWLKKGINSFGGSQSNHIQFPPDKTSPEIGQFRLQDGIVSVQINDGILVYHDDKIIQSMILKDDSQGEPTILNHNSLSWYIIKRGERLGVRLKDSESPQLKNFTGIDRFPVNPKWRTTARFVAYQTPQTIEVPNVLGTVAEDPTPGMLQFMMDGESFSLNPIAGLGDKRWFIIFSDQTSGEETYGAGRFLYIDAPAEDGTAIIDFNLAYNPPCVFTPFATCPLPPEQNHLSLRITAGEKVYHGYDH